MTKTSDEHTWIPIAEPDIGDLETKLVTDALRTGWVSSLGPYLRMFEKSFAEYTGTSEAISVNNGTAALELSLAALGVGSGDEIIVPAHTFAAVPAAVIHLGAIPVFVDISDATWCLDPDLTLSAITRNTKAIIAVHSYGHPVDLDSIRPTAALLGIHIIEDCAEALGAQYRGLQVGSMGTTGTFSFYGNKVITTGEGGMVTTSSADLAERMRYLRDHAMDPGRRYYHSSVGYNFRMTNIQAAMGCAQLDRIAELLERRSEVYARYSEALYGSIEGLKINPFSEWATPVNWLTTVELPAGFTGQRDDLMRRLRQYNIDSRPAFFPVDELPPYREFRRVGRAGDGMTPVAQNFGNLGLSLPTSTLMTDEQIDYVCSSFLAITEELSR